MSLINDALRRKNEGNKPTPEKSDGTPMQPVPPGAQNNPPMLKLILFALIVLVLSLAALLFWKGIEAKNEVARATAVHVPVVQPLPAAPVETIVAPPPVMPTPTPVTPPAAAAPVDTSSAAADLSSVTNPAVPVAPPAPPLLKLHGIFFRPSDPTAMINGKTVGVGEMAGGARVVKIERQQVTVERNGKQEVLTME